jgi:curli biogenesis system outer membrane secretion channel CsgG
MSRPTWGAAGLTAVVLALAGGPGSAADITEAQREAYDGPKARIAVADFEDKMSSRGEYRVEYGRGMADMLVTALFQSNRYIVLEREKFQAVMGELKMQSSDLFRREAGVPLGELEGAELLVVAAITGFDPDVSGGGGTVGGKLPKGWGGVLGGIAVGIKRARVAADLRLVDVRTGRVVAATNVDTTASRFAVGGGGLGGALGGALGGFAKTPMESAIRELIQKAVDFVVARTPAVYYRHGSPAAPVASAVVTGATAPAPGAAGLAPAPAAPPSLPTIRSDFDRDVMASLTEVKMRGAVLSAVVSLELKGSQAESGPIEIEAGKSHLIDYATGQTFPVVSISGFSSGRLKAGESKTLRVIFKAPPGARQVGIVLGGLGSFEDVKLEP